MAWTWSPNKNYHGAEIVMIESGILIELHELSVGWILHNGRGDVGSGGGGGGGGESSAFHQDQEMTKFKNGVVSKNHISGTKRQPSRGSRAL